MDNHKIHFIILFGIIYKLIIYQIICDFIENYESISTVILEYLIEITGKCCGNK